MHGRLSACAGRAPQPVAVVQPQDRYVDCLAIAAEVQANNQKIQELASGEGSRVGQNVAAGIAGLFIWPLWFAMDFQGTAGKEITALQTRQQYLGTLTEQKRCGEAPVGATAWAGAGTRSAHHVSANGDRCSGCIQRTGKCTGARTSYLWPRQRRANGVIPGYDKQPISPGLDSSLSSRGR